MRTLLCLSLLAAFASTRPGLAAQPGPPQVAPGTNNMLIVCTNGVEYSAESRVVVFRGEVRVLEPQMYMECELLSVYSQTNSTGGLTKAAQTGMTNVSARLESIVAETNVLIMARDTTILGDKAIYTASNEVVVVRGILVIIETDKSYTYGEHFVFNRSTGKGYAIGPTVVEIKMEGTNAFKPSFGLGKKPAPAANPPAGGTK